MNFGALRCVITHPNGDQLDVSDLLEIGGMSSISFEPESDLGIMAHGDMQLSLDDSEGRVREFFQGAEPGDVYEVILDRARMDGPDWDRLFGGVLDVPNSVSYDGKEKIATVDAWSYSKLLEMTPADTIKRTIATKTASITAASRVLSFLAGSTETADLIAGDVIKLTNSVGESGTFTIDSITDGDSALVSEEAGTTLTDCLAVVQTPYYRDKTPAQIAALIAAEVGMELDASDFSADLASYPLITPLVANGGTSFSLPTSLVPHTTNLHASYDAADNANRKVCASPSTAWTNGTATNEYEADWTPYLTSQPGTIQDRASGADIAIQSDGQIQGPTTSNHYVAECVAYDVGNDTSVGDRWQLYQDTGLDTGVQYTNLSLYKNGVSVIRLEHIANPDIGAPYVGMYHGWIEFDMENGQPWFSYQYVPQGDTDPTVRKIAWYNTGATPDVQEMETDRSGQLRYAAGLGSGYMLFYDCPISLETGPAGSGRLYLYDVTNPFAIVPGAEPETHVDFALGYPILWTARAWNDYLVFLFQQGDAIRLAIYETTLWSLVAAYTIANDIVSFRCYLTLFPLTDGRTVVAGFAGREWFVLSLRYDGVIRYADFEDKSCADAAAQLAIVTNSIVNVDNFKTLSLRNRRGLGRGDAIRDLGVPLDDEERPLSEVYRSSVEVSGKLNTGGTISVVVGDAGDSASRLKIDSKLVSTSGMAVATAVATLQFVSAVRSQREVTVLDEDNVLKFGDRVILSDKAMVVYKGELDIEERVQHLTLLEVVT